MNCIEAERLFDPYLDSELSGSLRLEFDAHRLHCPVCQQKLALIEACEHIIAAESRTPSLSDDFAARVMVDVQVRAAERMRVRRRRLFIGTTIGLQAAAVLAFVMIWPFGGTPAPTNQQRGLSGVDLKAIDQGLEAGDRVAIQDLMTNSVELLRRGSFARDVAALPNYALSLALPRESGEASPSDPLLWLLPAEPADEPAERDPFSL